MGLLTLWLCKPEECHEGELTDINQESGCDERVKLYQMKWQEKKNTLKELLELFHNIESTKNKLLEDDPNLERSMTICQSIEKMLTPCCKLYDDSKKVSTVQTTLYKVLQKKSPL